MKKTIFLIGPRAAGKTTLGAALAQALGLEFADIDVILQQEAQASVAELVEREGWPAFRRLESLLLQRRAGPGTVVATGGGAVLAQENREFMRKSGLTFYLRAPADVLVGRLLADPDPAQRPSLTGRGLLEEVAAVLEERTPLYTDAADFILDAAAAPEAVLKEALAVLKKSG